MKTKKLQLIAVLAALFVTMNLQAQVTIGGLTKPAKGAILDLNSVNKGGLLFSNVALEKSNEIPGGNVFAGIATATASNTDLIGMVVYNTATVPGENLLPGLYVWTGAGWLSLADDETLRLLEISVSAIKDAFEDKANTTDLAATIGSPTPITIGETLSEDIVDAINLLDERIIDRLSSAELEGSPFQSYADFTAFLATYGPLHGGNAVGKFAYVTFTADDIAGLPNTSKWSRVQEADHCWRLDCGSGLVFGPTTDMTDAITAILTDEDVSDGSSLGGSDFAIIELPLGRSEVATILQKYRNNLKNIYANLVANATVIQNKQEPLAGDGLVKSTAGEVSYIPSPLSLAKGGTGAVLADGTAGQVLSSDADGAVVWSDAYTKAETANLINTTVAGQVNQTNASEKTTLYLDTNADTPTPGVPNSLFNPYKTWATLILDAKYTSGNNLNIVIAPGSDLRGEAVEINSKNNLIIYAESTPDATAAQIGDLTISGTTSNFAISGIDITGNLAISSSGSNISFVNSHITGNIATTSTTSGEPIRAFYHCTINGSVNLGGSGSALYYFENCWAGEGYSGTICTLDNPNGRLQLVGCEGLNVNRLQGKVSVRESILYSYHSENSPGENILYSGIAINPTTNELNPIVCLGDAKLMVGSFQYKRTGSDRHGVWLDSGIGTEQVRSNTGFANFTPVLSNSDGSQRTVANTMKDVFAGIDVKLGVLEGMLSGSASTIQDGANNTVEFVNSSQEVIYSFAKPEPMISSPSILIFQSEASAKLDTDSPIAQAINAAVTKDGKGLSTKDYEDGDQTRLQAQAAIMSVSNANGLTLNNGVLSLSNFLDKVYPVGSIYKTTAFSTKEAVQAQFGGTWEVFGTGRVLVGISSSETEFSTIGKTEGAKTVTLATGNLPAHTHSIPARTTGTESADHSHNINHSHTYKGYSSIASGTGDKHLKARSRVKDDPADYGGEAYNGSTGGRSATHTHTTPTSTTGSAGSGTPTAITNLQPYVVVYQYRRTN